MDRRVGGRCQAKHTEHGQHEHEHAISLTPCIRRLEGPPYYCPALLLYYLDDCAERLGERQLLSLSLPCHSLVIIRSTFLLGTFTIIRGK